MGFGEDLDLENNLPRKWCCIVKIERELLWWTLIQFISDFKSLIFLQEKDNFVQKSLELANYVKSNMVFKEI